MISPRIAQRAVLATLRKPVAADVSGPMQRFVSYFRGERHTIERLVIPNGPNLSLTGVREPHIHVRGTTTLAQIEESCAHHAAGLGLSLTFRPSNHEGGLVDLVQSARQSADAIIINPAGYSFTSIPILDGIKAFEGPVIEVHISNIHARDAYRRDSKISSVASGVIGGLGIYGRGPYGPMRRCIRSRNWRSGPERSHSSAECCAGDRRLLRRNCQREAVLW
jgi:3-dehydroquinate dehydratase II